ncbi:MAG: RpiB/LacA/LacB family sugar-phosphate isomerase [Alphaproteobacteria bacterium]|nr:RpiB/LacA/LacB family sugar-phosphate isomerase [Alphaproteobacteria bacterium]
MQKIIVSSDESTELTTRVGKWFEDRGYVVSYAGALGDMSQAKDWSLCSAVAAEGVAKGLFDQAILFCWTGTGASIAANKVRGVRAALCFDAATAKGARQWNDANVLVMSLRSTSLAVAEEICTAWVESSCLQDEWNRLQIERLDALDAKRI